LSDPHLVPQALATIFGVVEAPGRTLEASVLAYLNPKQVLIILDNCEHVVGAAAALATTLLNACPGVTVLASSREALAIAGERVWRVPSLAVPDPGYAPPASRVVNSDAVRLFAERGAQVQPGFAVTEENARAVARICARLDGIPLAIELAAARLRLLSPEQIAARLDDRFRLLTGGSRTALPRQQTLRALIDWSWDLLNGTERATFRRLAVFAGGWTLEAAEGVCAADELPVLDGLAGLLNKSLVVEPDRTGRYGFLETIRQYGMEKLDESGEAGRVRSAHRDWFLQLAERGDGHLRGPDQAAWMRQLTGDEDNLRVAFDWCKMEATSGTPDATAAALRLAGALWFWFPSLSEGRRWLDEALGLPGAQAPSSARAQALLAAGYLAYLQTDYVAARTALEASVALCRSLQEEPRLTLALSYLAITVLYLRDVPWAQALCEESLALATRIGDRWAQALAVCHLGYVSAIAAGSRKYFSESVRIYRQVGDERAVARGLNGLGEVARIAGNYEEAAACYEESLSLYQALGLKLETAMLISNLGSLACMRADYAAAAQFYGQGLQLNLEVGATRYVAGCISGLGQVAVAQGDPVRAARLFAAAQVMITALGSRLDPADRATDDAGQAAARALLDSEAWEQAWSEGEALSADQVIRYALQGTELDSVATPLPQG
ncbi:MAG TPA: tetratricopeptide repeat protein, partial [Chloroflexia bacterium]|nr:tetratricopeptide repeat protein [Chloroflexia bacterium]